MPASDKALPENSKANLDRKLDHAIEETFPTSDPASVSITKGGAIDYDSDQPASPPAGGGSVQETHDPGDLASQARETLGKVAAAASDTAREAYRQGRRYVDAARERYPEAERHYREGTQTVGQYAAESPLLTLLVGVGIGYALAWMFHSGGSDDGEQVPDYVRVRGGYAAHYPQPRA